MKKKCYEIRLQEKNGPWKDGTKLWVRVATVNGQADTWESEARRLVAAGKFVACYTCGVLPGGMWIEGEVIDTPLGPKTTWGYVCNQHLIREKIIIAGAA